MDILDVDLQTPHDGHDELTAHPPQPPPHVHGVSEHHRHHDHDALMDSAAVAVLDASAALSGAGAGDDDDESGVALQDDCDHTASLQQDTGSSGSHAGGSLAGTKRKKVGKALQLLLLRKYVQCAKQLESLPSRATTEQLLDDGYDEFYLQGGSLSEPRLGYTAFLKLVRNRRGEVMRQTRDLQTLSHSRGSRRHQKERMEIRSLIHELERVRQSHLRSPLDLEALDGSDDASTSASVVGSAAHSATAAALLNSIPAAPSSHAHITTGAAARGVSVIDDSHTSSNSTSSSNSSNLLLSAMAPSSDDVVVSRERLDAMLRFAQETLATQKQILDEVRAIERRLDLH